MDRYGREWNLPTNELCPICGQPDNCGDCDHTKLSDEDVETLGGKLMDKKYEATKQYNVDSRKKYWTVECDGYLMDDEDGNIFTFEDIEDAEHFIKECKEADSYEQE